MPFIEAPTTFYMGRRYDPVNNELEEEVVYYDSRDLTTHAVVVGMTGSGKTGMCLSLLEEAVLDNIPAICIDPKGDITNLLLTFPNMRPEDFAPWVNPDDARRAGMDLQEYTADIAQQWREGLQSWSIVPQRINVLKHAAQYNIYTPGSDAGLPISILQSLAAPKIGWAGYEEQHRERIKGVVTALLALVGKQADPIKDREHVLMSNIFENAWKQGQNLTLEDIIVQVQKPPFSKLGVFEINTFFPEKERFKLAMELNNIIAAPSFQSWINGEALDIPQLLYTEDGRPKVSIFYLAHLSEAERMFIVTLLLENMMAWMRTLSGTTSLRALLYFDEIYGYFPSAPYNPPSKDPLLRLLKQARAFGIGLVLATQNPGDLDYKGLSNAGTWIIGKLQTENDRKRVVGGLQSASTAESTLNFDEINALLSSLRPRVFLMHNVHDHGGPFLFHTRWTMSYLRGPLTRQQIRSLMESRIQQVMAPYGYTAPPNRSYDLPAGMANAQPNPLPATEATGAPADTYGMPPLPPLPEATPPRPDSLPGVAPTAPPTPPTDTGIGNSAIFRPFSQSVRTVPPTPPPTPTTPTIPPAPPEFRPSSASFTPPAYPSDPAPTRSPVPDVFQTPAPKPPTGSSVSLTQRGPALPEGYGDKPPILSSSKAQFFLPTVFTLQQAIRTWEQRMGYSADNFGGSQLLYKPVLLAQTIVRYLDRKSGAEDDQRFCFQVTNVDAAGFVRWQDFISNPIDPSQVAADPFGEAFYGTPSAGLTDSKRMTSLKTELVDYVYRSAALTLQYNAELDAYSAAQENRRDYLARVGQLARERRDQEIDAMTAKYDGLIAKLEDKLRKELRDLGADQQQLDELKREDLYTTGEAIFSLMKGRTTYTLSRMSRARRYKKAAADSLYNTEQTIKDLETEIEARQNELQEALRGVNDKWAKIATTSSEVKVTPLKKDIAIEIFGIGWVPSWYAVINGATVMLPAFPSKAATPPDSGTA